LSEGEFVGEAECNIIDFAFFLCLFGWWQSDEFGTLSMDEIALSAC